MASRPSPALQELAAARPNILVTIAGPGTIPAPEPVDIVWTTLNYHDFKNAKVGDGDGAAAINAAAYRALKPGGLYLVADHDTAAGGGASQTSTLHRIEGALVRREVERRLQARCGQRPAQAPGRRSQRQGPGNRYSRQDRPVRAALPKAALIRAEMVSDTDF